MCEAVDKEPHVLSGFDREVDALRQILGRKGVMSVDELRRGIEAIPEADYFRLVLLRALDPLDRRHAAAQGRHLRGRTRRRAGRVR